MGNDELMEDVVGWGGQFVRNQLDYASGQVQRREHHHELEEGR